MKKLLPYFLIAIFFGLFIWFFHRDSINYQFDQNLVRDYLRSQDIEDPKGLIHDRIFVSDSVIYQATGYLYAKGVDPATLNLHPPLMKYLFGFSILLTNNPYWVQIIFGLGLLLLTFWLSQKVKLGNWGYLGVLGLLVDPVFNGMMNEALLDVGQAFFALLYIILVMFYPENFIFQGIILGFFAASKFWTTAIIFVILIWGFKIFIKKEKVNWKKLLLSFGTAIIIFSLTYIKSFIDSNKIFNIFAYQGMVLKFMLTHNSATLIGGPILLFITGYFSPWWTVGIERAKDWFLLWPLGLAVGVIGTLREFREKTKNYKLFVYLFPIVYLLLTSTQVPFARYFILILPFIYLGLADFLFGLYSKK